MEIPLGKIASSPETHPGQAIKKERERKGDGTALVSITYGKDIHLPYLLAELVTRNFTILITGV